MSGVRVVVGGLVLIHLSAALAFAQDCLDYSDHIHHIGVFDNRGARKVVVVDTFAYLAYGLGIQILDVTHPESPVLITLIDTPGSAEDIVVVDGSIYVADGTAGLRIFDVSTPSSPVPLGNVDTPGLAVAVTVAGSHVYIADTTFGLQVIDITDQSMPVIVGHVDTPDRAVDVAIAGSFAYVADTDSGLQIVDVMDPKAPSIVGTLDISRCTCIEVAGAQGYLSDSSFNLHVLDLSTPSSPMPVGSLYLATEGFDLAVSGNLVFVAGHLTCPSICPSDLVVVDVSLPESPAIRSRISTFGEARGVAISAGHAYVACTGYGLDVLAVEDATSPEVVGIADTPGYPYDLAATESHVYVADGGGGLQVIDVTTPGNPQLVGSTATPDTALGLDLAGTHAYVADRLSGLQVIDISNPSMPEIVGGVDTPGGASDVVVSGSYAYVADSYSGMHVIDVSIPESPLMRGTVGTPTPHPAVAVAVSGPYAYIAGFGAGLHVVDVSNPDQPEIVATVPVSPGIASDVAIVGEHAYIAAFTRGLQVVDIAQPTTPKMVASLSLPGLTTDLAVSGNYAYIASSEGGFHVVDAREPQAPVFVGSAPRDAWAIAASGAHVFVGHSFAGVLIHMIQCVVPSAVELASFEGVPTAAGNLLTWDTSSEVDHLGFRVQRSPASIGHYVTISGLIEPPGPYHFNDANAPPGTSFYRLEAIDRRGASQFYGPIPVRSEYTPLVHPFQLEQSRPNPFGADRATEIAFGLARRTHATVRVFDAGGRLVKVVLDETLNAGSHVAYWNGENGQRQSMSRGVYFYRLDAGEFSQTRSLIWLK